MCFSNSQLCISQQFFVAGCSRGVDGAHDTATIVNFTLASRFELVTAVACEQQVGVAVHESGNHRTTGTVQFAQIHALLRRLRIIHSLFALGIK